MTGYSRFRKSFPECEIVIELHSVNKKHFDLHCRLPEDFYCLEATIRKSLSSVVARGHVTVSVKIRFLQQRPFHVVVNKELASSLQRSVREIIQELHCDADSLLLSLLEKHDVFDVVTEEITLSVQPMVEECLQQALQGLIRMKNEEGAVLAEDLLFRTSQLFEKIQTIEERTGIVAEKQRVKLLECISNLRDVDSDAFAREIALIVEKMDIIEELVRFRFHAASFRKTIEEGKEGQSTGKVLEFILQELQREINTIGSKSQDALIGERVIQIKGEIERMREQVQNVE